MFDLISQAAARRRDVEVRLSQVTTALPAHMDSAQGRLWLCETVRWLVDFGHQAEAYEIGEKVAARYRDVPLPQENSGTVAELLSSLSGATLFLRIVKCHLDSARKRNIAGNMEFFQMLTQLSHPWWRGHGASGLGMGDVFSGQLECAATRFREASELFRSAGSAVDDLKMRVRLISCLRFLEQYSEADAHCRQILEQGASLGVDAVTPLLCAQSLLGSNAAERGNRHEARRFLRDAARLARALPPSQAGAFAMFQYGRILAELQDRKEALVWLHSAEKVQRVEDPIARTATLMALARCHRLERRWSEALECLSQVRSSRVGQLDPLDAEVILMEFVQAFLGILDFESMDATWAEIDAWLESRSERAAAFLSLRALVQGEQLRWGKALALTADDWEVGGRRLFVDFQQGRALAVVGRPYRFVAEEQFRADSGLAQALHFLIGKISRRETTCSRKELLATVDAPSGQAGQRKISRVVEALRELHLLSDAAAGVWNIVEPLKVQWSEPPA